MPKGSVKDTHSSVTIKCCATRDCLDKTDVEKHTVSIWNKRGTDLHLVECCVMSDAGLFNFNDASLAIFTIPANGVQVVRYTPMLGSPANGEVSLKVEPTAQPGIDTIQTVVDFYDSTQKRGGFFRKPKESYDLEYDLEYRVRP